MNTVFSLLRMVGMIAAIASGAAFAGKSPSQEEIDAAMLRFPSKFLGVSCHSEEWLPEAVFSVCVENDQIVAGGSIEFNVPPMDHASLIDSVRKKNASAPNFKILSQRPFEIEGAPDAVNVRVDYQGIFKPKSVWLSWRGGQLTRVLVNGESGLLPEDIHSQVAKAYLGGSPFEKAK